MTRPRMFLGGQDAGPSNRLNVPPRYPAAGGLRNERLGNPAFVPTSSSDTIILPHIDANTIQQERTSDPALAEDATRFAEANVSAIATLAGLERSRREHDSKAGRRFTRAELLHEIQQVLAGGRVSNEVSLSSNPPNMPPKFLKGLKRRRDRQEFDQDVHDYYAYELSKSDSCFIPGQPPNRSLLGRILQEGAQEYYKEHPDYGFIPIKSLGAGGQGSVMLWELKASNQPSILIAVKTARWDESWYLDYNSEGHLTKRLNDAGCENVVRVVEWALVRHTKNMRTVYEYTEYGDLHELLQWYRKRSLCLPEAFIWHVFHSMANALLYCKQGSQDPPTDASANYVQGRKWEPILHSDIKPGNILLGAHQGNSGTKYPVCKLADFGLSFTLPNAKITQFRSASGHGTEGFMAPEVSTHFSHVRGLPYDQQGSHSDVYSLAVTMYHLIEHSRKVIPKHLQRAPLKRAKDWKIYPYSKDLQRLLLNCVSFDARHRVDIYKLWCYTSDRLALHERLAEDAYEKAKENEEITFPQHLLYFKEVQERYDNDHAYALTYRRSNFQFVRDHVADLVEKGTKQFGAAIDRDISSWDEDIPAAGPSNGPPPVPRKNTPLIEPASPPPASSPPDYESNRQPRKLVFPKNAYAETSQKPAPVKEQRNEAAAGLGQDRAQAGPAAPPQGRHPAPPQHVMTAKERQRRMQHARNQTEYEYFKNAAVVPREEDQQLAVPQHVLYTRSQLVDMVCEGMTPAQLVRLEGVAPEDLKHVLRWDEDRRNPPLNLLDGAADEREPRAGASALPAGMFGQDARQYEVTPRARGGYFDADVHGQDTRQDEIKPRAGARQVPIANYPQQRGGYVAVAHGYHAEQTVQHVYQAYRPAPAPQQQIPAVASYMYGMQAQYPPPLPQLPPRQGPQHQARPQWEGAFPEYQPEAHPQAQAEDHPLYQQPPSRPTVERPAKKKAHVIRRWWDAASGLG
ncbi:MAG: hypothetical protein M1819_006524 [Sarea resinae]|nr:MAG: hypothetical protein M1819_000616 [Sarea resinae]KAI9828817.1 MAG: hypothetical protein M1819_006524 [Sarea resinae]